MTCKTWCQFISYFNGSTWSCANSYCNHFKQEYGLVKMFLSESNAFSPALNHGLQHGHTLPHTQFLSLYFCIFLSGGQTLMHWPQRCCSGKGAERPVFLSMEVWNSGCGQCLSPTHTAPPPFFSLSTVPISCGLLCRTVIFLWWNTVSVCSIYCIQGGNI